jgi:hypothetical protein
VKRFILCFLSCLTFACEMGTIPEEELILDYRIMPIDPLDTMLDNTIQVLQEEMDTESIQFLSIHFNTAHVNVTVVNPKKHNRVYDYSIRGTGLIYDDLKSETFDEAKVFTISDFPHGRLSELGDEVHTLSGLSPGAFCGLKLEREKPKDQPQVTMSYCIKDGLKSSKRMVFDHQGKPM